MRRACITGAALVLAMLLAARAWASQVSPPDVASTVGRTISFDGFVDQGDRPFTAATAQDTEATAATDGPAASSGAGPAWILSPIYTSCPNTCSALTAGLQRALSTSGLEASEYRVVSFSFDPDETAEKLASFRQRMRLPERWATLRARDRDSLASMLRRLDFRTRRTASGAFQHPNLVVVLTPGLRIAGYVFGVPPSPSELARLVRQARVGVPTGARWHTLVFFFALLGFLASTFVFLWLLFERRTASRLHAAGQ